MPIYKGNVEIDKVYKGATELDNIQLGNAQQWIGIIVTPDPTIAILSTTQTTVTVRLTNTHVEEVTIFYEANDTNPDAFSAIVPASSFVDRTITGLSIGSSQTIYAYALQTAQLPSTTVSLATSTLAQVAPTISNISTTTNSITFRVRNNNAESSIVRARLGANPLSSSTPAVTLNPGVTSGNLTISSLSASTTYSLRAASFINNISGLVATSSVTTAMNLGPGPTTLIAGNMTTGFFGLTTQAQFGKTMAQFDIDLGTHITGININLNEDLLKFIHNGKIKFINRRPFKRSMSWDFINTRLSENGGNGVVGGRIFTFGGNSYRVRLMRGWGQVSGSTSTLTTPNYTTGPLYTWNWNMNYSTNFGNSGVNWPNNNSSWSQNSPNEWNTLILPICTLTQDQTSGVPTWASYTNLSLTIASGNNTGAFTLTQETRINYTSRVVARGANALANITNQSKTDAFGNHGMRLVFELI